MAHRLLEEAGERAEQGAVLREAAPPREREGQDPLAQAWPVRSLIEESLRLLRAHGVEALLTRDRDFSAFTELRRRNPLD